MIDLAKKPKKTLLCSGKSHIFRSWLLQDGSYLSKMIGLKLYSKLEAKIQILKTKKSENFPPASNVSGCLMYLSEYNRETTYSNFKRVIENFATIPVMSYSCERSFSKLSIVWNQNIGQQCCKIVWNIFWSQLPYLSNNWLQTLIWTLSLKSLNKWHPSALTEDFVDYCK